jgi:hypothetical protein
MIPKLSSSAIALALAFSHPSQPAHAGGDLTWTPSVQRRADSRT